MVEQHLLTSVWEVLSERPAAGGQSLAVAPALSLPDGREILAGVDSLGNRHVLVPLLPAEQFGDAGHGKTLQLKLIVLPEGRFAATVCLDRRLDDIFSQFAKELVESVQESGKPGRDMRIAFGRWRALFSEPAGQRLTKLEEIGLFGELLTLREVLVAGGTVSTWDGPNKSLHDFRLNGWRVEIKTTLAREGLRITVHGVEQLSVPATEDLHLLVYRLEESHTGMNLPELVRDVEMLVDDLVEFELRVRKSGFDWQDAPHYRTKYTAAEVIGFDVSQPGFPKIVPSSFVEGQVPRGTFQLAYVVDLSGPSPTPVDELARVEIISRLAMK